MKKIVAIILLCVSVVSCWALEITLESNGQLVKVDNDTVFLFDANETSPEVRVVLDAGHKIEWFSLKNLSTTVQYGMADFSPEYGEGYVVVVDDEFRATFFAVQYQPFDFQGINITNDCEKTLLELSGDFPELSYTNRFGQKKVLEREIEVQYSTLEWNESSFSWQSVEKKETYTFNSTLQVGNSYDYTAYKVTETSYRSELRLPENSITSSTITPKAIAHNITSTTTIRGADGEIVTELERPTLATALSGSAPLDILFQTNATPGTESYQWRIYKNNVFVVQRTDPEQRYTFLDAGSYRIVGQVSNIHGCIDSAEIEVTVSESQIKVPNIFTPNGDGVNDLFLVQYRSIAEFNMWVYNRWGKLVFSTTDPDRGWDGTIYGKPAAEGAYFYVIRAKGTDANHNDYKTKKKYDKAKSKNAASVIGIYQLSGSVSLLRGGK